MGERDLGGERRPLGVARRVVVVVVEPALADGDRPHRPVEQVGDRVDAVARLVRVQPDGGVDARRSGRRRASASSDDARSQPTVIIVVTPAAAASATSSAASRRREVAVRVDPATARQAVMRGNSGGPLVTGEPAGVAAPRDVGRHALVERPSRAGRCAPRSPAPCRGSPATARMATIRSASRASPSTASTCRAGLELPRLVGLEVGVRRPDQLPRGLEGAARRDDVPRRRSPPATASAAAAASGLSAAGAGPMPPHFDVDDGGDAGGEVAEVVGEIGVVAPDEALVREVAVLAVRRVGEHVVAEPVDADGVDEVERLDDVARRLAHLLAAAEQPAADGPALRRLDAGRHQHRRPVHAVLADDVLADQVVVDRPPLREALGVGAEADGRQVVGQGVEPHVGDVARVPRQRDAPRRGWCG